MIGAIIIGLIAGWLVGKLMRGRGYGFFADIALGLVGAVVGGWLFARLGVPVYGGLSMLAMATIGAILLIAIAHLVRGDFHI
jgi:uncharacterized membrane protein YeaQ/YmgE (transglycosylase-associated protein family)